MEKIEIAITVNESKREVFEGCIPSDVVILHAGKDASAAGRLSYSLGVDVNSLAYLVARLTHKGINFKLWQ